MNGGAGRPYSSISELPLSARALLREVGQRDLFMSEQWADLLFRHCMPEGRRPIIYVVSDPVSGEPKCIFFGTSGPGSAFYSKRNLSSLTNFYTMRFSPVFDSRAPAAQALDYLVSTIVGCNPKWDTVELKNLVADDPTTIYLNKALRGRGMITETYFQFENWYHPTAGLTGDEYFALRPSKLRHTIERKWRKANTEHRIRFELNQAEDELLEDACSAYQQIYARSWKNPERYPEFIPNLIRVCAANGNLRLGILRVDDVPAAAQIWLLSGRSATIYKLAYDERFAALSVGSLLTKLMFDHVLNVDRVDEVDYGTGSEPYKRDWMSDKRDLIGLIAYNPRTIAGLTGAGLAAAIRVGKHAFANTVATVRQVSSMAGALASVRTR